MKMTVDVSSSNLQPLEGFDSQDYIPGLFVLLFSYCYVHLRVLWLSWLLVRLPVGVESKMNVQIDFILIS